LACVICGSEATVEAHLVPRALYRMLAGTEQHGFEGSRFNAGVRFQAKGVFDKDLLCRAHEDGFGEADDYGVRFIRTFHDAGRETMHGRVWLAPNPRPELLVRFMAGLVWRRGMSVVVSVMTSLKLWFLRHLVGLEQMNGSFAKVDPKSLVIAQPPAGDQHCPKHTEQRANKKILRREFSIKLLESSNGL